MNITFFVPGTPKPAGSKRGFANKKTGRVVMVDSSGQAGKDHRHDIRCAAQDAMADAPPLRGPVEINATFYFDRPKLHYGTGKNANIERFDAPVFYTKTPDVDKLCRQILDGLTSIVYVDDSQVWQITATKCYCPHGAGTKVEVSGVA